MVGGVYKTNSMQKSMERALGSFISRRDRCSIPPVVILYRKHWQSLPVLEAGYLVVHSSDSMWLTKAGKTDATIEIEIGMWYAGPRDRRNMATRCRSIMIGQHEQICSLARGEGKEASIVLLVS